MAKKVLTFANIHGCFDKLAESYAKIVNSKSGGFDVVLLLGYCFSEKKDFSLLSELTKFADSTCFYILDTSPVGVVFKHQHANTGERVIELHKNVFLLGRSGIIELSGLNIAFLCGLEDDAILSSYNKYKYTGVNYDANDVNRVKQRAIEMEKNEEKIDLLLLNTIPFAFYNEIEVQGSLKDLKIDTSSLKSHVSYAGNMLASILKPRYILSATSEDFYYERVPFINQNKYISRFIHVSNFPVEKRNPKEKFIYAVSLKPIKEMKNSELYDINVEYTANPVEHSPTDLKLILMNKRNYTDKKLEINYEEIYIGNLDSYLSYEELLDFLSRFGEVEYLNMIYDKQSKRKFLGYAFAKYTNQSLHEKVILQSNLYSLRGKKVILSEKVEKTSVSKKQDIESSCWFCWNNPNIENKLILKAFKNFYLAYSKGPIDDFHFLIVPKEHLMSYPTLKEDYKKEMVEILRNLLFLFDDNKLDYIIYEKNLPYKDETAKHMLIQVIGIRKDLSFNCLDIAHYYLEKNRIIFTEHDSTESLDKIANKDFYYYIDIPTGIQFGTSSMRTKIFVKVKNNTRDCADLPRNLICEILETPDKANWKNTQINEDFLTALKGKINKYFPEK